MKDGRSTGRDTALGAAPAAVVAAARRPAPRAPRTVRRRAAGLTAALTLLGVAAATAAPTAAAAAPVRGAPSPPAPVRAAPAVPAGRAEGTRWDGTWQTDGYGRVVSIRGDALTTYDLSSAGCLPGLLTARRAGPPDPSGALHLLVDGRPELVLRPGRTADDAVWNAAADVTDIHLHRLPALPAACRAAAGGGAPGDGTGTGGPARVDPRRVFDTLWATFADNYPFFAEKGIDWPALGARNRARLDARTSDADLLAVLADLLRPLGDAHAGIDAGATGRFWQPRPGTLPVLDPAFREAATRTTDAALGAPLATFAAGHLQYADLPDGLGYLRITSFQHYTADGGYAEDAAELGRALDTVLTPERTAGPHALRGLVVDLRLNGGGSDRLALQVAARLADRPYPAFTKQARDDPRDPERYTRPQPVPVVPAAGPRYTGPVAVLTGSATMSAAETLTMALTGRSSRTLRIGAATQGVFSDVLERALPNGWTFDLPNERYLTPQGRDHDVEGIPPTIAVPVYTAEDLASGRDSALAAARAALR